MTVFEAIIECNLLTKLLSQNNALLRGMPVRAVAHSDTRTQQDVSSANAHHYRNLATNRCLHLATTAILLKIPPSAKKTKLNTASQFVLHVVATEDYGSLPVLRDPIAQRQRIHQYCHHAITQSFNFSAGIEPSDSVSANT